MATTKKKENVKQLINKLNLGTAKEDVGAFIVEMAEQIEALEARVAELESAVE